MNPTLHIICGLPGSGKSTLGRKLEKELPGFRFCPDEWIKAIFTENNWQFGSEEYQEQIEALQLNLAKRLLQVNVNVIMELSTVDKDTRNRIRIEAQKVGARVKLHFLELPVEELKRRIIQRNLNEPTRTDTLRIEEDILDELFNGYLKLLEVPTPDELANFD